MFDKNQLAGLMKKAQEMQSSFQKAQEEVAKLEVTGESGAGLVRIVINGKHDVRKVFIDPSIVDKDEKDMLEDLVAAAFNDAARKLEEQSAEKMGGVTSGIPGMPPGFKLPF